MALMAWDLELSLTGDLAGDLGMALNIIGTCTSAGFNYKLTNHLNLKNVLLNYYIPYDIVIIVIVLSRDFFTQGSNYLHCLSFYVTGGLFHASLFCTEIE